MRLNELKWHGCGYRDRKKGSGRRATFRVNVHSYVKVHDYYEEGYWIVHFFGGRREEWADLDALTAQAVLFDLCSRSDPC